MDTLSPSAFALLDREKSSVVETAKAYARETRAWTEPDGRNQEDDYIRRIAAQLMITMIRDYWVGKENARKYGVFEWADLVGIPAHVRTKIEDGDAAYRWLTERGEQLEPYTFRTCCLLLNRDPGMTAALARMPQTRRALKENKRFFEE